MAPGGATDRLTDRPDSATLDTEVANAHPCVVPDHSWGSWLSPLLLR